MHPRIPPRIASLAGMQGYPLKIFFMKIEIEVPDELASFIKGNPYWILEAWERNKRLLQWQESQKKAADESERLGALPITNNEIWGSFATPNTDIVRVGHLPDHRKKEAMSLYRKGVLVKAKHPYYTKYLYLSRCG